MLKKITNGQRVLYWFMAIFFCLCLVLIQREIFKMDPVAWPNIILTGYFILATLLFPWGAHYLVSAYPHHPLVQSKVILPFAYLASPFLAILAFQHRHEFTDGPVGAAEEEEPEDLDLLL